MQEDLIEKVHQSFVCCDQDAKLVFHPRQNWSAPFVVFWLKKKRDSASSCAFLIDPTLSASCIKSPEYIIRVHRFSIDGNVVYTAEAFPTPRRRAPNKEVNSGGSPTGHLLLFSSPLLSFLTLLSPHLHNNSILFSLVDRQKFHFVSFLKYFRTALNFI